MRDRLHFSDELELERRGLRFAGQPMELLTGGSGMYSQSPSVAPQNTNGALAGALGGQQPHHGVVGIVLFAVLVLFILDRAGFRFAVTAGRR